MRNGNHRKSRGTGYLRQQWAWHSVTCLPDENAAANPRNKDGEHWRAVGTFTQGRFETNPSCLFPLASHCFLSQPQELPCRHILRYFSLQQVPFLPKVADAGTKLVQSGRQPADNYHRSQGQWCSCCPLPSSQQDSPGSRRMLRDEIQDRVGPARCDRDLWPMSGRGE